MCECYFKGLTSSPTQSIAGFLVGLGAEQVYGVKLRTFIVYLFIFKIFFFLTWTIFKVFTQLVTTLLLFCNVLVYGPEARGGLAP